jgi:hypothetical protein
VNLRSLLRRTSDYDRGHADGVASVEARMAEAASSLSDRAKYQIARSLETRTPCTVDDCRLSMEEHHRLAYGIIAENRELRRQVLIQNQGGKS